MGLLHTETITNVDISVDGTPLCTYTIASEARILTVQIMLSGLLGNDNDYSIYMTRQRGGAGAEYEGCRTVKQVLTGNTTLWGASNLFWCSVGDVVKIYALGTATDTTIDGFIEIWEDVPSDSGTGAISWTLNVNHLGVPIDGVDVWVTTDLAGANVVARGYTDTFGQLTVYLDAGTYYAWKSLGGYTFTNPEAFTVV